MVGGVLAERTAKEVIPSLQHNIDQVQYIIIYYNYIIMYIIIIYMYRIAGMFSSA